MYMNDEEVSPEKLKILAKKLELMAAYIKGLRANPLNASPPALNVALTTVELSLQKLTSLTFDWAAREKLRSGEG
jgi:hypothetical protein